MHNRCRKMALLVALVGLWLATGCKDRATELCGEEVLAGIPGLDPRAIVVLGYLDHQRGLTATAKWPRVAFAIGDGSLLLTAAHCVEDFREFSRKAVSTDIVVISPYYGDVFDFRVVAIDKQADVAILKAPWPSHPALALATEEELLAAKRLLIAGRPQTGKISPDLQAELLPVAGIDESVPNRAVKLSGTRLVAPGWSGSAILIPHTGKVAGVLTQLDRRTGRDLFFRSAKSDARGCSVRSAYALLRAHGLEAAALGHPANIEQVPDSELAFSAALAYFQAVVDNDRGKLTAAADELTRLRPRSVQAHLLAGMAAMARAVDSMPVSEEQFDQMESNYRRALEIDPNHAHAHAVYGNFLMIRGRNAQALAQSEAALAIDPNNRLARFNQLTLLPPARRKDAAERLLAKDPNDPSYWFHYGGALLSLGHKDEALRAARKAVALDPNGLFYGLLAEAYWQLGRLDEAEPCYKLMTERCGCDLCWYRYAMFLADYRESKANEGLQALKTAEAKTYAGRIRVGDLNSLKLRLLEKVSPQEAETLARALIEAEPNNPVSWWHLASILRTQGKYPQAVEAAQKAVALCPDSYFQGRLANCLAKAGRLEEARHYYDEMVRVHPDRPRYWFWYAESILDFYPDRLADAQVALDRAKTATDQTWSVSADEIHKLQERIDAASLPSRDSP
jgi:pentatricopeptide repeat protein